MRLGLLTDVHLGDGPTMLGSWHNRYDFAGVLRRVEQALAVFANERVDAIALVGDVAHHGARSQLATLDALLATAPAPVLAVAGNHDGGADALAAALPSARLARPQGDPFDGARLAGIHVAAGGWFRARAELGPAVAEWGEGPTVLLSHYPLLSHAARLSSRGLPYPGDLLDRGALAAALHGRAAPTVVLSGHIHARDAQVRHRVLQLTHAALIEAPYECSTIELLDGPVVQRRSHPLDGPPPDGPLPLLSPAHERFVWTAGGWRRAVTGAGAASATASLVAVAGPSQT